MSASLEFTVDDLVYAVRHGQDINVRKGPNGRRIVCVAHRFPFQSREVSLGGDAYDHLMREAVEALAALRQSGLVIDLKTDHYGQQWVEVRSGLFGRRVSHLGISPRHITQLGTMLAQQSPAPPDA